MFSELRNDRRRRIGELAAADRLRDRDSAAGSTATPQGFSITPQKSAITPQKLAMTPQGSSMFLEDKFPRG